MKYVPHAWAVTLIGVILTVRGIVMDELWLNVIGDAIVFAGLIWLWYSWDKHIAQIKRIKRFDRQMDKLKKNQEDSNILLRATSRKADEAKAAAKSKGQHIKGFVREGDRIINFERKEA